MVYIKSFAVTHDNIRRLYKAYVRVQKILPRKKNSLGSYGIFLFDIFSNKL